MHIAVSQDHPALVGNGESCVQLCYMVWDNHAKHRLYQIFEELNEEHFFDKNEKRNELANNIYRPNKFLIEIKGKRLSK